MTTTDVGPLLQIELRYRWEPTEQPPDGWRSGATWLSDDGAILSTLWTGAPPDESPFAHEHRFIRSTRITQRRYVSEWTDGS